MTTLARVRGGRTGVRFISLEDWKNERLARRGKAPPSLVKSRRQERMEAKMRKRAQRKKPRKEK